RSRARDTTDRRCRRLANRPVLVAVTARARPGKDATTTIRIAGLAARPSSVVGWNLVPCEGVRSPPAFLHSANEDLDLLICERAARAERKRWLRRSRHAHGDHLSHALGRHHGEVDRIVQRTRRPQTPGLAVTAGALTRVERLEHHALARHQLPR